ncbi:hypothetical protein E2C01_070585 [Portunus trituberculatus]|uniref:Uncharacterized protein n=1 Tax=Portunus trituberculatus TaxID=210409 RepID=A0A5B7I2P2_PORTR|nr:hypothetical protein [Portunus trituberculatus]
MESVQTTLHRWSPYRFGVPITWLL